MNTAASSTATAIRPSISRYGLTQIATGGDAPEVDFVFVHGLQGHPEKTWTAAGSSRDAPRRSWRHPLSSRKNTMNSLDERGGGLLQQPCFWPADLLAPDFPNARIFTYGYDSAVTHFFRGPANNSNIFDYGRDLLQRVSGQRKECPGRPLIFVVHSLGGILVKSVLKISNEADDDGALRDINSSTIAILFFGTPHRGSFWSDRGKVAARFVNAFGLTVSKKNLELLTPNNALLEELRNDFTRRLDRDRLYITSYQEQKGFKNARGFDDQIVSPDASAIDHRKEQRWPINANHMEMCKFRLDGDSRMTYDQLVKTEVERHIGRESVDLAEVKKGLLGQLEAFNDALTVREKQIDKAHDRTLSWLFKDKSDGPGLVPWLAQGSGLYWIQGLPGSGKSTAMKRLVHSQTITKTLYMAGWSYAAMFITDRITRANRSWKGVLGAMLFQVLRHQYDRLSPILKPYIFQQRSGFRRRQMDEKHIEEPMWSIETLEEILLECKRQKIVKFSFCFFIDALDENDRDETPRSRIVEFMERLVSNDGQGLGFFKICAASRPENEFDIVLRHRSGFRMQDWTLTDIRNFVHTRLESHPDARNPGQSASYHKGLRNICETIIDGSQGVFLWVRLVVNDVWDRLTGGESFASIQNKLRDLPKKELPEFFMHILKNTPLETRRATHAVLETLLRAQDPVSVLDIGVLLRLVSNQPDFKGSNTIKDTEILELSNSGPAIERRIKALTGGLVQVVEPTSWPYLESYQTDDDPVTPPMILEAEKSDESERSSNNSHGSAIHAATWRVQFLHQTVKEFLQSSMLKTEVDAALLLWPDGRPSDTDNGYVFHMRLADACLGLKKWTREKSQWALDPGKIIVQHAPGAELYAQRSFFDLLQKLDRALSEESKLKEGWVSQYHSMRVETWGHTFLSFAVSCNMQRFVADALKRDRGRIKKRGRPLLHFSAWSPGTYPNPQMAQILLNAGADPNETFHETHNGFARTALESLQWNEIERDGRSHVDFMKLLISNGAKVSRRIPRVSTGGEGLSDMAKWSTVQHHVAGMPLVLAKKLEILNAISKDYKLNTKQSDELTVFDILILSENLQNRNIKDDDIRHLLQLGAKITLLLAHKIHEKRPESGPDSNPILDIFLSKEFQRSKFYKTKAWWFAAKRNS
ncbi:hypothetical protein G7Z17_g4200 [Cylindrodendrum hubeiense]|uniref:Nephrocystin 3-like N-terminal domain-containing protein n=1 Tax=Cylindrodendrum hubeiense TaxID=595255 RepID=A0A9P5HFB9_9HYPO|nr:hypothetical protein G7Z17_g4200 [Cylindrodendrum hubeiense]